MLAWPDFFPQNPNQLPSFYPQYPSEDHTQVKRVTYPGLASHAQHDIAKEQMNGFSGMISLELKGGIPAGISLMNNLKLCSLAESLGAVETMKVSKDVPFFVGGTHPARPHQRG